MQDHKIVAVFNDNNIDGQIGLKLKNCKNDLFIGIVGLYLSPDNYIYGRDAEGFFNNAAVLWEDLSDCDLVVGAGDVNARSKEIIDFIPEIDGGLIPPRVNPDQTKNSHGECFLTFLKENRSVILNGRITPELNNFTFVSPNRGSSVPDYQFCPSDHLQYCIQMKTLLMSEIVNLSGLHPPINLPDHSVLLGTFDTSIFNLMKNEKHQNEVHFYPDINSQIPTRKPKKDLKKLNVNFFMSEEVKLQVQNTILKLENLVQNQAQLDQLWSEVKNLLLNELDSLPDLPKSNDKKQNKIFKKSQPFWNENLKAAWANVCRSENEYLLYNAQKNGNLTRKKELRLIYQQAQKTFDSKFRFFKRKHRKAEFEELEVLAKTSPNQMWAKLKKLSNPPSTRAALEIVREDKSISTDIKEILQRWHADISKLFSGLRENPDFAFDDDFYDQIVNKKEDFEALCPEEQELLNDFDSESLNSNLTYDEVSKSIDRAKMRKAYIEIPNEAIKNENAKLLFHKFFQLCFISGLSPTDWDSSHIKPIPKKEKDSRDPLQNRCITLMCCVAKLYSSILNRRLQLFLEKNKILVEEQNGFRASRSCIDHILVLCSILRNRKALGLSTFLSFIDFQKAFDSIDRNLLFFKLSQIGISGKFYNAIKAMYSNPRSKILLNEYETDFFDCPIGVKQGDNISATLFSIFINDLAEQIKETKVGINLNEGVINDSSICPDLFLNILLYADDICLMTTNENDLQFLLSVVENWCQKWRLEINLTKTNVMHVRNPRCVQSRFVFLFNHRIVTYCESYRYLGATLDEFLNFDKTAEVQAEPAGRALGALITKTIKNGGLPYSIYSMLFECSVSSISDYGAEIWGFEPKDSTTKIHLRAARCFLGLPKHATSAGVLAEISWPEPVYRAHIRMIRQYFRIIKMEDDRLTKQVYTWDKHVSEQQNIQTWSSEVRNILFDHNQGHVFDPEVNFCVQSIISKLKESMSIKQAVNLKELCQAKPKLRTFVTFKDFGSIPSYICKPMSFICRKYLALTRLSNLSIRIETGRYERPRLEANLRFCPSCNDRAKIEDEFHLIFQCVSYIEMRANWLSKLKLPENFHEIEASEKLKIVLNKAENVKLTGQFILDAFNYRSKIVKK